MTIDRVIYIVAGFFVMLSVTLSVVHHQYWLFFTAFVGFNLFQSGFTQFCPLSMILKKVGCCSNTPATETQ